MQFANEFVKIFKEMNFPLLELLNANKMLENSGQRIPESQIILFIFYQVQR